MSVAAPSPFCGSKRLYEQRAGWEGSEDRYLDGSKRSRGLQACSPSGRCGPETAYAVGHSTVAALQSLFPEMSDKVIAEVLSEYGDNIDAAIKHLTSLRLTAAANGESAAAAAAAAVQQAETPAVAESSLPPAAQAAAQEAAERVASLASNGAAAPERQSAEGWVNAVVTEMGQAADVADARARAAKVLQAFEQAVLLHKGEGEGGKGQLAEAQRENALLKRAVAIQAARISELGAGAAERELAELRGALEAARGRLAALEMQNYSLQLHLKQAADSRDPGLHARHNPDIF